MTTPVVGRKPNLTLHALRLSMQLSRREFADLIRETGDKLGDPNNCTKRLVQHWESGRYATCRPRYRRALEEATHTPFGLLGFVVDWDTPPLGDLESPSDGAVLTGRPGDRVYSALDRPTQVDEKAVIQAETTVTQLFDLEQHQPARLLLPTVSHHLDDIAGLLTSTRDEALRKRLATTGGDAAALAGWLAFECGDAASAHFYWDSAVGAARDASSIPLLACVFTYKSYVAMEHGDFNAAWQLAHTASELAGDEPRTQAWMNVRAAQAAARRGDSGSALASLKLVCDWDLEIGPPPAPNDNAPSWARFVDHAYLWAMITNVYTYAGARDDAYRCAVRALDTLSGNRVKARAITLSEAAYAFAYVGGFERAIYHAREALELADVLEVTSAKQRLRALVRALPKPLNAAGRELERRLGKG